MTEDDYFIDFYEKDGIYRRCKDNTVFGIGVCSFIILIGLLLTLFFTL